MHFDKCKMGKHSNAVQIFKCGQCRALVGCPGAVAAQHLAGSFAPQDTLLGVTHFISIAVQYLFTFIYNIRLCFACSCASVYEIFRSAIRKVPQHTHSLVHTHMRQLTEILRKVQNSLWRGCWQNKTNK